MSEINATVALLFILGFFALIAFHDNPSAPNRGDYVLNRCVEFFEDNTGKWTDCAHKAIKKYEEKYGR